jgi:hypothetical protein
LPFACSDGRIAAMARFRLLSWLALALTVGLLLVALPACGGDDNGEPGETETTETTAPTETTEDR